MKKKHLRPWVKDTIVAGAIVMAIILSVVCLIDLDKKAVNDCIEGGNSETFCRQSLLR